MNNIQVDVGRFCATLRRKLFQEHLGLLNEPCANVLDPVSDEFFKVTLTPAALSTSCKNY